jgi:membrane protease YdiL (CAAX protease family)
MSNDSSNPKASQANKPQGSPKSRALSVFTTTLTGILLYVLPAFLALAAFQVVFALLLAGGQMFHITHDQVKHFLDSATISQFLYVLFTELFALILLSWLMRITRDNWRSIGVRRPKPAHIIYTFIGLAVYFAIYIAIATLLTNVLNFDQKQELGFDEQVTGINLLLVFISLVVLPPIAEEIIFRGYLYTRFKRVLSLRVAAIAVSLLFASGHLQVGFGNPLLWTAALDTFILSLVLVYVREKTGTVWAGVGIHAMKNLIAFSILFVHIHAF